MGILLMPPLAFVIYLLAAGALLWLGKAIAGVHQPSPLKRSLYASGNPTPAESTPSYGTGGFMIALFFAALHLGALFLVTSDLAPAAAVYIGGLALTLIVLLLR